MAKQRRQAAKSGEQHKAVPFKQKLDAYCCLACFFPGGKVGQVRSICCCKQLEDAAACSADYSADTGGRPALGAAFTQTFLFFVFHRAQTSWCQPPLTEHTLHQ